MTDKKEPGINLLRYEALLAQQRDNQVQPDYQAPPPCKAQADYRSPPCFITEQPSNQETPLLANLREDAPQSDDQSVVIGLVVRYFLLPLLVKVTSLDYSSSTYKLN